MTFKAPIIAVRAVDAGETVGYGSTWVADRPTKLAVIAAGYADGYPRQAPSGTPVALSGHLVHLAGRISMDMMTVSLPDEVELKLEIGLTLGGVGAGRGYWLRCNHCLHACLWCWPASRSCLHGTGRTMKKQRPFTCAVIAAQTMRSGRASVSLVVSGTR